MILNSKVVYTGCTHTMQGDRGIKLRGVGWDVYFQTNGSSSDSVIGFTLDTEFSRNSLR